MAAFDPSKNRFARFNRRPTSKAIKTGRKRSPEPVAEPVVEPLASVVEHLGLTGYYEAQAPSTFSGPHGLTKDEREGTTSESLQMLIAIEGYHMREQRLHGRGEEVEPEYGWSETDPVKDFEWAKSMLKNGIRRFTKCDGSPEITGVVRVDGQYIFVSRPGAEVAVLATDATETTRVDY